ncbi:hypothetical protein HZS_6805 [Henneguya salminicola]|nr:hypothetical protein HZS_6805 [Henneguya salminicola]
MEVDSQHDSEIDNKSITLPSPTPTPTSNPHVFPSQQPFFENPYIVFPSQVDYFPINLPLSYEGYITPTPPVTGYTKQAQSLEFLSTCTVVDYNHGINENPDQSTDFPPYDDYQNPNIHLYSQQQDDNPTFLPPLFRDDCEYPHNHHRTQFYPE